MVQDNVHRHAVVYNISGVETSHYAVSSISFPI